MREVGEGWNKIGTQCVMLVLKHNEVLSLYVRSNCLERLLKGLKNVVSYTQALII